MIALPAHFKLLHLREVLQPLLLALCPKLELRVVPVVSTVSLAGERSGADDDSAVLRVNAN
jgi:hypothetical protein